MNIEMKRLMNIEMKRLMNIEMKRLIIIAMSAIGLSCCYTNRQEDDKEDDNEYNAIIDLIAETTPLMQPYLCLSFSREYCDSIRHERQLKLNEYAKIAKTIKNKKVALDYFMFKVSEIRNDVNMDYARAMAEVAVMGERRHE